MKNYLQNLKSHSALAAGVLAFDLASGLTVFVVSRDYGTNIAFVLATLIVLTEICAAGMTFSLMFDYYNDAAPVIFRNDVEPESDAMGQSAEGEDYYEPEADEYEAEQTEGAEADRF